MTGGRGAELRRARIGDHGDVGVERARARDADASDRIGGRSSDYHHKVETAFHLIAAEEAERVKLVDASGRPDDVTERLLAAVTDLLR